MKPHKHAELIKAWADGAEIQYKSKFLGTWHLFDGQKDGWVDDYEYRIKPEPKPDVVLGCHIVCDRDYPWTLAGKKHNLKLTFDGETGELKSAEVLK